MKKLLVVVGLVLGIVVMAVVIALLFIDGLVRTAVERGGTYALQVDTRLVTADVGLMKGTFHMEGLAVANPGGFDAPRFLTLGSGDMAVSLASMRSDVIEIPRIALDELGITLERRNGRSNYGTIVENLRRLSAPDETGEPTGEPGTEPPPGEPAPEATGPGFIVGEVVISNIEVTVDFVPQGGELTKLQMTIDELRLTDIGRGDQDPVALAELVGIVVQAVLQAIADKGGGIVPGDMLRDLQGELDRLPSLSVAGVGVAVELSENAKQAIEEGLRGAEEAAEEAGRTLEGLGRDAGKAFEGLIPGRRGGGGGGSGEGGSSEGGSSEGGSSEGGSSEGGSGEGGSGSGEGG